MNQWIQSDNCTEQDSRKDASKKTGDEVLDEETISASIEQSSSAPTTNEARPTAKSIIKLDPTSSNKTLEGSLLMLLLSVK